uniref:Uncharacterized protein n=1 Tax=Eucampia antarctica TaxID=49252 RepID=A0A7S2S2F5_9STRA|mmetsp:Transcript_30021/g.28919  ORF Transcript_30021/g.28919 Transcript_30021/m.28919 type:complete len:200 (+) Transcript_30021:69-668(+)|eukprot:CAMPEP_0197832340 /NCGR_PEP_ID=MMETSP1437-20131217/14350_1 /TAXON_ID=49252 ORGANISM="Eucampia antarctica, Strain CCMP1452" /NCGR_SAMPLE_ID=MMETSP1437 /ASSEMBLY_ACC=CAM_ASM_001096 /LENGTH=199 /DNA_ID=CAMNT_0043435671 /DNA_START=67 /DNA_END=666 /DNA_ORIENTATION=+
MVRSVIIASLVASAAAFAPAPVSQRTNVALNAEMSKALPFLVKPEKLDGSMAGDFGFDPMGLSEIQVDLKYARWAELKHGRICMLAIVGMIIQEAGIHVPGSQFTEVDPFAAINKVGYVGNMQIFLTIGIIELANFDKYYGEGQPGDIGFGSLKGKSDADAEKAQVQEIKHARLAMIGFMGAVAQTVMFHTKLIGGGPL